MAGYGGDDRYEPMSVETGEDESTSSNFPWERPEQQEMDKNIVGGEGGDGRGDTSQKQTEEKSNGRRHGEERRRSGSRSRSSRSYSRSESHRKSSRRSRTRSRDRDRDRSSRHDKRRRDRKTRHRHRSSSRSSKSSRSRSRSRSSERRSRHHRRRRRRSGSRNSSDDYSDYNRFDYKTQYDSYKYQEPNSTIMVRGLALHLTENDIRQDVLRCGIMVKDIRLIRNRDTGGSRGFAFVEFNSIPEATRWMDMKKGLLVLHDQFQANLIYSIPKVPSADSSSKLIADWYCDRCHGHNFKRREFCYKCNAPRPDEPELDLHDEISTHPTSTIILSNLDTLTTEEGVLQAFQCRPHLAAIPIKNVKIAREPGTSLSRGICYVEANNVSEATRLFGVLTSEIIDIDGRAVSASYGRTSNPATLLKNSNAAAAALAAAQWTNRTEPTHGVSTMSGPPCTEVKTQEDVEKMAQYCATVYAKTPEEYAYNLDYYRNYYRNELNKMNPVDTAIKGSSQKVNHPVHQQPQQSFQQPASSSKSKYPVVAASGSQPPSNWSDKQHETETSQGIPDTSRYQYDETSGYYYDPNSGLYYDATTQYFYDAEKQQFLHWSPLEKKYVAVVGATPSSTSVEETSAGGSDKADILNGDVEKRKGKKGEKQDKVKVAKRVAKEMEKWAKTLNQKKDGFRQPPSEPPSSAASTFSVPVASSSHAFSVQDQREYFYTAPETTPFKKLVDERKPAHSEYDSGSDEEKTEFASNAKESSLVDESKLACLLCKRRFASLDVLHKHVKMSDLHKKNLESLRQGSSSSTVQYRDRAKERREQFGSEVHVGSNSLKDLYLQAKKDLSKSYVEKPTAAGIKSDNIGNQMLQRMGWQEGQGLGKDNRGRTDIIMAERHSGKLGLGLHSTASMRDDDDLDPQSKARKLTLARYQELQ